MSSFSRRLLKTIYSRPYILVTNTITGIVSISIGDIFQQNFEHNYLIPNAKAQVRQHLHEDPNFPVRKEFEYVFDKDRTKNMMYAGVYFSLFGHWWYSFLDRRFPPQSRSAVRNKILAECFMGPSLVSSVFIIIGRLRGQSLQQAWDNMVTHFWMVCQVEWLIYIPLQWINFTFVPAQFRYLYVAVISIGYDAFLSFILHRNELFNFDKKPAPTMLTDTESKSSSSIVPILNTK